MSLINFTVEYDTLQAVQPVPPADVDTVPLSGTVRFVPQMSAPAQAAGFAPRPAGVSLRAVNAVIDTDGQLKDAAGGNVGVRLVACDPVLGLANLPYVVQFSLVDASGAAVMFPMTSFEAPATDTVINLVSVMPVPGAYAQGVTVGAGACRTCRTGGACRCRWRHGVRLQLQLDDRRATGHPAVQA